MKAPFDPTEAEIRAACERIRAAWPPGEHERRLRGMLPGERRARAATVDERFIIPVIRVAELALNAG